MGSFTLLAALVLAQAPVLVGPPGNLRRSPVVDVVRKAGPAVANISTEIRVRDNPFALGGSDRFFERFFGRRGRSERRRESLGSGVLIDDSGLVLTNEHVISGASNITVTLADRRTFEVDVVGADPAFDIAVLKVRGGDALPAVRLGASDDLMPGEPVVAIGNPFGLSNTVTTGVVSALHRSIRADRRVYEDFVQTDAAINPGNSGGALLNIEGQLIGINTAIYRDSNGIGFAIPIDKAMAVVEEVLQYGEVRPAYLGLRVDRDSAPGARVHAVAPGGPADRAGLASGDWILDVGGQEVRSGAQFRQIARSLIPGRTSTFTVRRARKARPVDVLPDELTASQAAEIGRRRLGLRTAERRGVLVVTQVDPRSPAGERGIRRGDLLIGALGKRLRDRSDFEAVCVVAHDADAVTLVIGRRGRSYYLTLELDRRRF